ncbi:MULTISPECIES: bifunctional glutamate N-acetyltransferase/amino-acid acetyltransferase ArgJ [unclassified Iodidimonas]|jgi:glutamate N-acetyltransferase/amino-acid N-acetyltransferase|uniref:bifunctional glutamate N-acetyltransferase/amino-acid acetyltransferase ArgJ n=1 Tax=unclassified Iodidimonas TaxID=2626145 RepID=UPI0024831540|nr:MULTISPECIES: bifunctional glutamate N-acetyltransferase/amino-acid acetyltransferase ArgJ [unclassified Iodidimonas]
MAVLARSPLAPDHFPDLPPVPGIAFAVAETGARYKGRVDLLAIRAEKPIPAAGVFTRSLMPSAAVDWCKSVLPDGAGHLAGILVNAGNANAFTGKAGALCNETLARAYAAHLGCTPDAIALASTGVIGEPLDPAPLLAALPGLAFNSGDWEQAARAISTTDTFPKGASARARIDGDEVVITGIAKGSGMIQPDMATMLGFICTNAAIAPDALIDLLREAVGQSFNRITVDSDTSTSDSILMLASGCGVTHSPISRADDPRLDDFRRQLKAVLIDLAHQVVRDGEGAQKFITIKVTGAENEFAAQIIGFAIANSPLIKTAIAGSDPNWGRIIMAVGKSGQKADRDRLKIWLGDQLVAEEGARHPDYSEAAAAGHMRGQNIAIHVDVAVGEGAATVWTCDLTHGYISINADYRS